MINLDLAGTLTALRAAQESTFNAEARLRQIYRVNLPQTIADSPSLQRELDGLAESLDENLGRLRASAAELVALRNFLNDLLEHFQIAAVRPTDPPESYSSWINSIDRLMACRAGFAELDGQMLDRDRDDPQVTKRDEEVQRTYTQALADEIREFARVSGLSTGDTRKAAVPPDRASRNSS